MSLSSELISQFVKSTKNEVVQKSETTVYGEMVEYQGRMYVRIDGSDRLTPTSSTTDVKTGDRVSVMVKDHSAIVTGNLTSPAARLAEVKDLGNQIGEFETVMAHTIVAEDIDAINVRVEALKATLGTFTNLTASEIEAATAQINEIQSKIVNADHLTAMDIDAINADIENLRATFGSFTSLSTEDLEAVNADIDNLKAYNASFTYVSTESLKAVKADIKELDANKLSAIDADLKYANIDFSNIGKAAMEYFYANSGLIKDVVVGNETITGELVGVTIKGDLIEGNTIVADKLVIKGTDGLYYKLNTDGVTTEAEQTAYNSINGNVILAKSITASKISVTDLVAFGATIGGFHITDNAIYSGVKETANNTTRGIYLDNEGQLSLGDSNQYLRYTKDQNGDFDLEISAKSLRFGTSNRSVEEEFDNVDSKIEEASKVATNYMNFDETNGLVVGNMTANTLGNNVRIDSDSVDIRSGSNVLATFASDLIELGKNAVTSVIDLCKGVGQIKADKDSSSDSIFNRLWIIAKKSLILRGQSVDISCTTQHNNPSQEYANSAFGSVSCTTSINEDLGTVSSQSSLSATCVENGNKATIRAATNGNEGVGSGEIYIITDGAYGEHGIYMNSSYFGVSTRDSQLTLSSEGMQSITSVKITNKSKGYYLTAGNGASYPAVFDNGSNLWIGAEQNASTHHIGGTYISAGHTGSAGNSTIYVAVPNAANNGSTNYGVFHTGYLDVGKATTGTLPIARGGTGATTAVGATTNLEAMRSPYKNGYRGMATPGNDEDAWIRTTSAGLIPYKSGGGSSSLGTSSWPFYNAWTQSTIARSFHRYSSDYSSWIEILVPRRLWSGTMNVGGSATITNLDRYYCFIFVTTENEQMIGIRTSTSSSFSAYSSADLGSSGGSWVYKASCGVSGTKLTLSNASKHKLLSSGTSHSGARISIKEIWGVF